MNPRILFFMATGSPVGGVATWLDRASVELADRGYEIMVGLARGLQYHDPDRFRRYHQTLQTLDVDGRGLDREGRIRACQRIIRKVNPHFVLPLGILDANLAAMREKARGRDLRLIGRAQGNLPPMLADLHDYRDGLDHVVCVGAMTRNYLVRHAGFTPDRVDHIPNGAAPATTARSPRMPGSPLRIGYIGRFSRDDKRVLDIPPFCFALNERGVKYHMTIVGAGPCEEELRQQLSPLSDHVVLTGALTSEAIYSEILPNLDILMLFSSSETFGIVLAEAMMNGVVPVTSRYIGFQSERLVVHGKHGLSFPVGDVACAADAVVHLNDQPSLLSHMASEARQHASTFYTWKRCYDEWDSVLQQAYAREKIEPPIHLITHRPRPSGLLDRIGIPPGISDTLRRFRRMTLGVPIPPGGEEWPLYSKSHAEDRLAQIRQICRDLESCQP